MMRRFVVLTGRPGVGKTTAVVEAVRRLRARGVAVDGFWTEEVRKDGSRVGFDVVRVDGTRTRLSRKAMDSDVRVGSYGVLVDEAAAVFDELREAIGDATSGVCVVDEVGPMELKIPAFRALADAVVDSGRDVLATYKQGLDDARVERLRSVSGARDWTVTRQNRDEVPGRIVAVFTESTDKR